MSDYEHAEEEAEGGVSVAVLEVPWYELEPSAGKFDAKLEADLKEDLARFRAAGRKVTLAIAFHEAPDWVLALPDARMIDDKGRSDPAAPNLVFNQRLRNAGEAFVARLAKTLDFTLIDTIRITSGAASEIFYPYPEEISGFDDIGYMAFDRNAQNGPDLPPTMAKNPFPRWKPGSGGLSEPDVRRWADWYVGALLDVVAWQMSMHARLGFKGSYEMLTPGSGVKPRAYDDFVRRGLPHGLLGTGAAWQALYSRFPKRTDIVANVSSVADGSGDDEPATRAMAPWR